MPTTWITPPQTSERLQVSLRTLRRWRKVGEGPPYYKVGGRIRYCEADVEAFEESLRRG